MIEVTTDILQQMVDAIVNNVHPQQIILFGSRVRGNVTQDSDLDLLVVEQEPFENGRSRRKEMSRIRKALSSFRAPKDILVYSADEVGKWRNSLNHIIAKAYRDGEILYEKD